MLSYICLSLATCVSSAIDCVMSEWTEWSECNKSCGKGHAIRTRIVMLEPQFGGDPCSETIQRKKCKIRKCNRGQGNNDEKKRRKEQREKRRSKQGRAEGTSEHPGWFLLSRETTQYRGECDWLSFLCFFFMILQDAEWDHGQIGQNVPSYAAAAFKKGWWRWSRGLRLPSCPAARTGRRSGLVMCIPARKQWVNRGGVMGRGSERDGSGDGTKAGHTVAQWSNALCLGLKWHIFESVWIKSRDQVRCYWNISLDLNLADFSVLSNWLWYTYDSFATLL